MEIILGLEQLKNWLPINHLFNADHRIWYGYLVSSIIMAIVFYVIMFRNKKSINLLQYIFYPKVWFSKSSFTDISLFCFNYFFKIILIAPLFFTEFQLITFFTDYVRETFPNFQPIQFSPLVFTTLYTIMFFIISDFSRFFLHYLFHKFHFLWTLHKVHHSATVLTPLTLYRVHPIESVASFLRQIATTAFVASLFLILFAGEYPMITIFGVQIFGFLFNFFGSNLRHSHVPLSFGATLESILISPLMHQMHHSVDKNKNKKNLGSCLAIWDILFGTYLRPDHKRLRFGLSQKQRKNYRLLKLW